MFIRNPYMFIRNQYIFIRNPYIISGGGLMGTTTWPEV